LSTPNQRLDAFGLPIELKTAVAFKALALLRAREAQEAFARVQAMANS
jgi:hypothetical protein